MKAYFGLGRKLKTWVCAIFIPDCMLTKCLVCINIVSNAVCHMHRHKNANITFRRMLHKFSKSKKKFRGYSEVDVHVRQICSPELVVVLILYKKMFKRSMTWENLYTSAQFSVSFFENLIECVAGEEKFLWDMRAGRGTNGEMRGGSCLILV